MLFTNYDPFRDLSNSERSFDYHVVRSEDGDIWAITSVWEGASDRPGSLSHVQAWALRASDQSQVAFTSCG